MATRVRRREVMKGWLSGEGCVRSGELQFPDAKDAKERKGREEERRKKKEEERREKRGTAVWISFAFFASLCVLCGPYLYWGVRDDSPGGRASHRSQQALGRERDAAQAPAGGVEEGVGERRGDRAGTLPTSTTSMASGTRSCRGHVEDRVARPVDAEHRAGIEADLLVAAAAERHEDVGLDHAPGGRPRVRSGSRRRRHRRRRSCRTSPTWAARPRARAARPSTCTVQAPHCARPQPKRGPC